MSSSVVETVASTGPSIEEQGATSPHAAELLDLRIFMYKLACDKVLPSSRHHKHHHDYIELEHTPAHTQASSIVDTVTSALDIPANMKNLFSIWLISPHLKLQLKSYHAPFKIYKKWRQLLTQYTTASARDIRTDKPALYLRRNAFMPVSEEKRLLTAEGASAKAINLIYLEAVHSVVEGHYPIGGDDLLQLSQIQSSVENGGSADVQLKYLEKCWSQSFYGCAMFTGKIERKLDPLKVLVYTDREVMVAINPECIHIFTVSNPRKTLLFLKHGTFDWDFQAATELGEDFYSSLWLEFKSKTRQSDTKTLQIFSRQAPMMDAMISRCVEDLSSKPGLYRTSSTDLVCPDYDEHLLKCAQAHHV